MPLYKELQKADICHWSFILWVTKTHQQQRSTGTKSSQTKILSHLFSYKTLTPPLCLSFSWKQLLFTNTTLLLVQHYIRFLLPFKLIYCLISKAQTIQDPDIQGQYALPLFRKSFRKCIYFHGCAVRCEMKKPWHCPTQQPSMHLEQLRHLQLDSHIYTHRQ